MLGTVRLVHGRFGMWAAIWRCLCAAADNGKPDAKEVQVWVVLNETKR